MAQATPSIPDKTTVLVIGGGPGGSYTATCLAREQCNVVLLEAAKFPRYHIGESTLSSMQRFLDFIDFREEFESYGFQHKNGAAFAFGNEKRHGFTNFCEEDASNYAWNVVRSESDHLLLKYASRSGVKVFEETKVTDIEFDGDRPIAARYKQADGDTGKIYFDYLVDSSGRNGVMSSKYLKNRVFNPSLKNVATWGYWTGVKSYKSDNKAADNVPFFESLADESGWSWVIPLHNGTASVGIVMAQESATRKKAELDTSDNLEFYMNELKRQCPLTSELIAEGKLVQNSSPAVKMASDYSYSATSYAGPHYRLVGDAACFIDPFFSSGIHLAMSGGLSAAATILASINRTCSEVEAANWHHSRVDTSYTRFLVVVLTAYRQIRNQKMSIISDVSEDGFDCAFDHFRTIIQGRADVQQRLQETAPNLRDTIEYCKRAFDGKSDNRQTSILSRSSDAEKENMLEPQHQVIKQAAPLGLFRSASNFVSKYFYRPRSESAAAETINKPPTKLDLTSKAAIADFHSIRFFTTGEAVLVDDIISDSFEGLRLKLEKGRLGLVGV